MLLTMSTRISCIAIITRSIGTRSPSSSTTLALAMISCTRRLCSPAELGKIPEAGADILGAVLDHQAGLFDLPPQGVETPALNR